MRNFINTRYVCIFEELKFSRQDTEMKSNTKKWCWFLGTLNSNRWCFVYLFYQNVYFGTQNAFEQKKDKRASVHRTPSKHHIVYDKKSIGVNEINQAILSQYVY